MFITQRSGRSVQREGGIVCVSQNFPRTDNACVCSMHRRTPVSSLQCGPTYIQLLTSMKESYCITLCDEWRGGVLSCLSHPSTLFYCTHVSACTRVVQEFTWHFLSLLRPSSCVLYAQACVGGYQWNEG